MILDPESLGIVDSNMESIGIGWDRKIIDFVFDSDSPKFRFEFNYFSVLLEDDRGVCLDHLSPSSFRSLFVG